MYSIFAPGKTAINVADVGHAVVTLSTPQVQDYLAQAVQDNAQQRGYIVTRAQSQSRSDLIDISVTLIDHSGDLDGDVVAKSNLRDVIATWARRSRVPGVSGDRVAVIGPIEQVATTSDAGVDAYQVMLRLGTAVFFNDRRVTVDFAQDKFEFAQDLKNLFDHLGRAGAIGMLNGVIVEHEEFGEIHSGNTSGFAAQGSLGYNAPAQTAPTPSPVIAPTVQVVASAPSPVAATAPVVVSTAPAAQTSAPAPLSDEDLEELVNVVRLHTALLRVTDRASLKTALAEVVKRVADVQNAL